MTENDVQTRATVQLSNFDREQFEALGTGRYGSVWKLKTSNLLGINRRTLGRWIAKGEFPQWAVDRLSEDLVGDVLDAAIGVADVLRAFDMRDTIESPVVLGPEHFAGLRGLISAVDRYREGSGRAR